ncbi:hypothetical protein V8E55_002942 [Tylopilus felleus]
MLVEPQEYLFHREDEHSRCLLAIKVPVDQPTNSPFLVPHPLTFSPRPLPNMQDPKKEIPNIIQTLCTTRDVNELEATVKKYFGADAEFFHPLCKANSRNEILGLSILMGNGSLPRILRFCPVLLQCS